MLLSQLPPELILEIYRWLYDATGDTRLLDDTAQRRSWTLNLLATCMVCRSWYNVGLDYLSLRLFALPPTSLFSLLHTVECPTLPLPAAQPTWNRLLLESKQNKLIFHQHVRQLVLNLTPLLNPPLQPHSSLRRMNVINATTFVLDTEFLAESIKALLDTCRNVTTVEILYDSRYTPRITDHHGPSKILGSLSNIISDALITHCTDRHHQSERVMANRTSTSPSHHQCTFLSHLIFTAQEPIQRCPCCAGRGWDHTLRPLLQHLPVSKLELNRVLPSHVVLECLAQTRCIHTLVIRGGILIQASRLARYGASLSAPPRIPLDLLAQLRTLEIYLENDQHNSKDGGEGEQEELDLLAIFRQTYDMMHPIKALQTLVLHGHKRYSPPGAQRATSITAALNSDTTDWSVSKDVWKKLQLLAERHDLKSLVFENIPGFQCPIAQTRLRNLFSKVEQLHVVYAYT